MAITSNDIAKLAGVSRSAVSAVLNGHFHKVSLKNKEKILSIARDLNYHPNRAALVLARKKTKNIGIITSPFFSAIYSELISKLFLEFEDCGYSCSIVMPSSRRNEKELISNFEGLGTAGIIALYLLNDARELDCGIPILSMSPYHGQYELRVDLKQALLDSITHLRGHGHEKIALLCPQKSVVPLQVEGYLESMGGSGCYFLEATSNADFENDFANLIKKENVTAFVATNDLLAARFIRFMGGKSIRVPEDIAIIGFDGSAFCETFSTPISSMVFPAAELALRSREMLLDKIAKNEKGIRKKAVLIPAKLYRGGSCGCIPEDFSQLKWEGQPLLIDQGYL